MKKILAPKSSLLLAALLPTMAATGANGATAMFAEKTIPNATVPRTAFQIRDPFVLPDEGFYYLYESKPWSGGKCVFVRRSTDLENWTEKQQVMRVSDDLPVTKIWAPEVHKHNGTYYLLVTITLEKGSYPVATLAEGREKFIEPRGTWVFKSEKPTGPFAPVKNGPVPPQEWMTLDGTLYVEDGHPYMVFCHEWCQTKDGRMCCAPLAPDLASFTAKPTTMFCATEAMAGAGVITDGPYFHRSQKNDALYMIWSNTLTRNGKSDYCVFIRKSENGKLSGPWSKDTLLFGENGGHGMIFSAFDGRLMLALHRPNDSPDERMMLFEVEDTGETLHIRSSSQEH